MSKKASPSVIGCFVLAAIIIAVAGVLVLGAGKFFGETSQYVMYFDSNLSGLDVGAPVDIDGVRIGHVADISLVYDHADKSLSIPVIVEIDSESFTEVNLDKKSSSGDMKLQIDKGMRAQLKSQSMVTGKLKVQLVYKKENPAEYRGGGTGLPEIPTVPGSLDSLAKRIDRLPLDEIILDLRESTKAFAAIANSGKLQQSIAEMQKTMKALSEMANSTELKEALSSLNATMEQSQQIMTDMNRGAEPLRREVLLVLEELSDAAKSAQYLMGFLERHPEALIHGKGR